MLTQTRKTTLLILALLLFLPLGYLQTRLIDPFYNRYYAPPKSSTLGGAAQNLPAGFALGAFTGFREAIAGMLWVRCDEFFHKGDYESIMPLIRLITWLDPHQIDVYETGAWHLDYNFTDSQERSDRRYIPLSLAMINEGIANNPDEPDLYSDKAFVHYFRKIEDYPQSADAFREGWNIIQKKRQRLDVQTDFDQVDKGVMTVGHGLAHALEFSGDPQGALAQWNDCIALHQELVRRRPNDFGEQQGLEIAVNQLKELQGRMHYRPIDTAKPVDMQFHPILERTAPKEFVLRGTLNAIGAKHFVLETGARSFGPVDGCRVEIRLEDEGYQRPVITNYTLSSAVDPNVTLMQDAASVREGKIGGPPGRRIDMSKQPQTYPFKASRYTVTIWFSPNNPNDAPIQVQDRIGWRGEGMTDQRYLVKVGPDTVMPGGVTPVPGLSLLKKTFTLTRDDILGSGKKVFQ